MTTKFKIEVPLMPNDLAQGTFEDIFMMKNLVYRIN